MDSKPTTLNAPENHFAPSPDTERAYSSNLSISYDGKWMAYCVANVVVLRSLEDLKTCKIFKEHKSKTSAVSFAPNKHLVASGDVEGNVKLWFIDDLSIKREHKAVLGSKIFGIEWDLASEKLFVFGDGKKALARCISWDTGNNVGDISGHSKVVLTGDMRKVRPIRLASGGEDFLVNFYEAYPCKLKKMNKEHTNFVTGVRFSPDGNLYVSVGFDKKIIVYDGKTGEVAYKLTEDKAEGNHKMAIIGVCWLDDSTIATCSLDRTVKVWDLNEKTCKYTLFPKNKESLDIPDSGCGIATNGVYLISLSLNGCLNFWNISELANEKLPDRAIDGHQSYISDIVVSHSKSLIISSDVRGKIILWNSINNEYVRTISNSENNVLNMTLSLDENTLYSLNNRGIIKGIDLSTSSEM
jgi:WD40 repeat protein